ncbi:MAG: CdaR family transcriptional regulator [Lachnospirales bacterium]
MILTQRIANKIIREVNSVISNKINIMNDLGIIIASSDVERANNFHEAAYKIVKEKIPEVIVNYDGEFHGALSGVNYPLKIQDYIVGVIGVTGKYDEIKESALIIKKMTELILENSYSVEQRQLRDNIRNEFLKEWFTKEAGYMTKDFIDRGALLGCDITLPRRIIACSFSEDIKKDSVKSLHLMKDAENDLKKKIMEIDLCNIYYNYNSILICGIVGESDEKVKALCDYIINHMVVKYRIKLIIGIGMDEEFKNVNVAFNTALKANKVGRRYNKSGCVFYKDLSMEIFSYELSNSTKLKYIYKLFKNLGKDEINSIIGLLEVYYEMEGSINKVSERLFMHKNTLQNKLKAIKEITGHDPRSLKDSVYFLNAIYFYNEIY